jgi:PAS domain S-box-containing protein
VSANTDDGTGRLKERLELLSEAMRAFAEATSDYELLLSTVAERTARALGAFCGFALVSADGRSLRPVAAFDPDPAVRALMQQLAASAPLSLEAPLPGGAPGPLAELLESHQSLLVPALSPEQLRGRFPVAADYEKALRLELRSVLLVPLRARGKTLGTLNIVRHGAGAPPIDEDDVMFARSLADHAALAIANAELFAERQRELAERRRLAERLYVLSQASQDFSAATGDYGALLDLIARRISDLVGEGCAIRLLAESGEWLDTAGAVYHPDSSVVATVRAAMIERPQRIGEGITGRVAATGKSLLIPVVDPGQLAVSQEDPAPAVIERFSIRSLLAVPLRSRGRTIGVAVASRSRPDHPYTEEDQHLLEHLAAHAALAVTNSRLFRAAQQELTERRRAEEARSRSEARFSHLATSGLLGVIVSDVGGRILEINETLSKMVGYTRAEILAGQPAWQELTPPEWRAADAPALGQLKRAGVASLREKEYLRKDGRRVPVMVGSAMLDAAAGEVISFVLDLSERKQAEATIAHLRADRAAVEQASRLKSQFLANMSHELRTPLNAIIGFADLMHSGDAGPMANDHREFISDILTSSRHLLSLINDILDLAKVESGKMELRPEHIELTAVVREVWQVGRGLATAKRLRIETDLDPEVETVLIDPTQLKQILYNYLSNAIKFTPDEGRVVIRSRAEGPDYFRLEVEDSGIGIAERDIHKLFIEFQQLDGTAGKKFQGTGLGLALTKRIAEAHGGFVAVRSRPGQGSTFSVILPRVAVGDRSSAVSAPAVPLTTGGGAILVVDDDDASLRLAEAILRQRGYATTCARSGPAALAMVQEHAPALVVLDLLMPGMDGHEFLARFREVPAAAHVPIILWTVKDLNAAERQSLGSWVQAVVPKGAGGMSTLLAAIERMAPRASAAVRDA